MTSIKTAAFAAVTALSLTACAENWTPREGETEWEREFFGAETYAELREDISPEDKEELQPVMELAEKAFSAFPKDREDAKRQFGELYRYTNYDCDPNTAAEEHELTFKTCKIEGDSGCIWVHYSQECSSLSGEILKGSWDILSRWKVEKQGEKWVVTSVCEPA